MAMTSLIFEQSRTLPSKRRPSQPILAKRNYSAPFRLRKSLAYDTIIDLCLQNPYC